MLNIVKGKLNYKIAANLFNSWSRNEHIESYFNKNTHVSLGAIAADVCLIFIDIGGRKTKRKCARAKYP
ncbi:hypothetical protein TUM4444_33900 [Shewanella sp. MBTL60-112-B1]|nr:hypothetical protein TUM4444_33900 [Shewanella sp. MBTL60-112-B1]